MKMWIDIPIFHIIQEGMAYRHRVLEYRLKKHLGLFPAVAVTGPRQSGKSTLLRAALPDFPYVSFDDPEEVQAAERDPRVVRIVPGDIPGA